MGKIVMASCSLKPGKEAELNKLMETHADRLRVEGLVTDRELAIMKALSGTVVEYSNRNQKCLLHKPHSNAAILKMWKEYDAVCDSEITDNIN
ncbi:MAG: hypothetical protein AAGA02_13620 [Bacteroidota bacterium]